MAPGDNTDSGIESLSSSNKSLATTGNKEMEPEEIDDEVRTVIVYVVTLYFLCNMYPESV